MSDYNKLNIRFSNYGWNITQDAQALEFGQYTRINNIISDIEGQLTARPGMTLLNDLAGVTLNGDAIRGIRRLNDSIQNKSTYVVRADTNLYVTVTTADSTVTTTPTFQYTAPIATGMSETFGSILVHRTGFSNQVWAYIGDSLVSRKIAISQTDGGIDLYQIGLTRPQAHNPVLVAQTGGSLTVEETYYYRYTFYDIRTGVESLFNENEDTAGLELNAVQDAIQVFIQPETPTTEATDIRIYRSSTASASWVQVLQVAIPTDFATNGYEFTDTTSDIDLAGSHILNEVSDRPFTTLLQNGVEQVGTPLPYWFGPIFGYILALGDPNNPGILYWTDKFNPDTQDPSNNVEITGPQDPLMNGVVFDGQAYVFSKEHVYRLNFTDEGFVPYEVPTGRGLFFSHAICVGPEIYYMSKDGVYATSGGPARLLTDAELRPLFHGESVNGYSPVDFTSTAAFGYMAYHEHDLWFHYRGVDGSTYLLIYDIAYRRWRFANFRTGTESLYSDEQTTSQLIMGGSDGNMFSNTGFADENGSPETIPCKLTTQTITLGAPLIHKEFGALIADVDPKGSTVTFTIYTNNSNTVATIVTDSSTTRTRKFIPINVFAENLTIDVAWAADIDPPILYGYELLYRPDTVQLERWSVTGVSHGIEGWQILRSAYITLRCDGDVTLTVTTDGTANDYTISSTGGQKRKVFIPFLPTKGKIFDYSLVVETASYFRLYNDMCEVHVKPWVTSLGYGQSNPFQGGEASAIVAAATPVRGESQQAGTSLTPSQGFVPSQPLQ